MMSISTGSSAAPSGIAMDYDAVVRFVQAQFTDGLALVIGSGLSSAEGMPGMRALEEHLSARASGLTGSEAALWEQIAAAMSEGLGLEAALLKHAPSEELESWIAVETAALLIPREHQVISRVLRGEQTLRLTGFLQRALKPPAGLPILTTNYDRLVEVACEVAGLHVDTAAVGHYAGAFDPKRSCLQSVRRVSYRARVPALDHFPRAVVLKPHGSFDWYRFGGEARRCSLDVDAERLIITPGLNKYRAGYDSPFDKHRELANDHLNRAGRLLVIGYGFNDDHLQTHLVKRIREGTPTLILNRTAGPEVVRLAKDSPACVCLSEEPEIGGTRVVTRASEFGQPGIMVWDLAVLVEELLA
jgi:hypothetical protein